MVVSSEISKVIYDGTGSQTEFPYTFRILNATHLAVVLTDTASVETKWTLNTQYVVTGVGEEDGGNIIVQTDDTDYTPQTGEKLTLYRDVEITQETDYVENDPFHAETHETTVDKCTMIDQQLSERLDRKLTVPISDISSNIELPNAANRANKLLGFDSDGNIDVSLTPTPAGGYYTRTEVDTISGSLQTNIDAKDNYSSWSFAVDGVTKDDITSGDMLDFVGGDNITITRTADDQVTISGSAGGDVLIAMLSPISVPPGAFKPENNSVDYLLDYQHLRRGSDFVSKKFYAAVYFPDGVTVSKLTLYGYRDDASSGLNLRLYRSDHVGASSYMADAFATWTGGNGSVYDDSINNATINNDSYTYGLELEINPNDNINDVKFFVCLIDFS